MVSLKSRRGGGQMVLGIIAIVCIAIAVAFILKQMKSSKKAAIGDAYYYCEDCKNEFVNSSDLIPPVKCPKCEKPTAVRALKFKGQDGKVFTGYYEKYDTETKRLIEAKRRGGKVDELKVRNPLVRTPEGDWVDSMSPEGAEILNNVTSPTDDSTGANIKRVFPGAKEE